jgi:hypothetical protein
MEGTSVTKGEVWWRAAVPREHCIVYCTHPLPSFTLLTFTFSGWAGRDVGTGRLIWNSPHTFQVLSVYWAPFDRPRMRLERWDQPILTHFNDNWQDFLGMCPPSSTWRCTVHFGVFWRCWVGKPGGTRDIVTDMLELPSDTRDNDR